MIAKKIQPIPKWNVAFDLSLIVKKNRAIIEKKQAGIKEPTVKLVK